MNKLKRILITLCLVIFVTNCEVKMKDEVIAQEEIPHFNRVGYNYIEQERDGMKYGIYYNTYSGGSIDVINITKDKLEVEKLQKELAK